MTDRLFIQCLLALAIAAVLLIGIGRYTGIDLYLADRMYDFVQGQFTWRDNWFAAVFMHRWMKIVLIGAGLAVIGSLIVERVFAKVRFSDTTRSRLHVVAFSSLLVPLSVSIMKKLSIHSCPWSLERYGGLEPYLRIFDALPSGSVAGHCFPAGHASSGLWLAAFALFWLPARPGKAAIIFAGGLVPGLLLGWVQQMRGAHLLTHTLWSAWITSLVILILARLLFPHDSQQDIISCGPAARQLIS